MQHTYEDLDGDKYTVPDTSAKASDETKPLECGGRNGGDPACEAQTNILKSTTSNQYQCYPHIPPTYTTCPVCGYCSACGSQGSNPHIVTSSVLRYLERNAPPNIGGITSGLVKETW